MKDNKGFSIVEIVIILAIISALGGAMFYSFTLMTGQYARECANNLSAALDKEKNYALTRSASVDCYMEIVKDGNNYVARYYVPESAIADGTGSDWVFAEELKIGKSRVGITYKIVSSSGSEIATIDDDRSVKFVYNRISGAMKAIVESDVTAPTSPLESGVSRGDFTVPSSTVYNLNGDTVTITLLNGRKYEIEVYTATGKHVLSRVD